MEEEDTNTDHHQHPNGVHEWESGLPSPEDLTPLSQSLITPELASAFGISPESSRSLVDLNVASHQSYSTIHCRDGFSDLGHQHLKLFPDGSRIVRIATTTTNDVEDANSGSVGTTTTKEEGMSVEENNNGSGRALKRPRLVWTPQLHKRFVDVIEHLGIDKAVPKTIMEMMNVEGLTRENVASHLQKYRLYLKRVDGGPPCDGRGNGVKRVVVSGGGFEGGNEYHGQPLQQLGGGSGGGSMPIMPIQMIGRGSGASGSYGYGQLGINVGGSVTGGYCALESGAYNNLFWNRQRG